jgi:hypothetical protein
VQVPALVQVLVPPSESEAASEPVSVQVQEQAPEPVA